jgi:hypothetical protein
MAILTLSLRLLMQPPIAGKNRKVFADEFHRTHWTCGEEKFGGEGWDQAFTVTRIPNDHF